MAATLAIYFIFLTVVICDTGASQCPGKPNCSCVVTEEVSKGEILAATVGALSSLLVAGGGLGIWKIVQNKSENLPGGGWSRESSDISETSENSRRSAHGSPSTNSTRASSRVSAWSKATALSLNDMEAELDGDSRFGSPIPNDGSSSPKWTPAPMPNRQPRAANSNDLNGWMF